jgi:hypothetical protein
MSTTLFRAAAAACVTLALLSNARGADLELPRDGWASWEIDAVDGARAWCCYKTWDGSGEASCDLDTRSGGHTVRDDSTTDKMRVYARLAGGKVERLRTLAASCPVVSKTPIQRIDTTTDDSVRWLISKAKSGEWTNSDLRESSLAAIAMHRGDLAHDELVARARGGDSVEAREKAVFWLGLVRGAKGAEVVTDLMFNDENASLRKHAAFAISVSKSPTAAANLTKLGNTDKDGDVRGQAWFWLANSGAPNAEAAISAALRKDSDDNVREKAIFALSRLPDERGTSALIKVAEDKSFTNEQRKRAVFWLAHSDSKDAQSYLEKVLVDKR